MRTLILLLTIALNLAVRGQYSSTESLSNAIIQSLDQNDSLLFKTTVLPKDTLISIILSDTSLSDEEKIRRSTYFDELDRTFYPMFMLNFKLLQMKFSTFNLSHLLGSLKITKEPSSGAAENFKCEIPIEHELFKKLTFYLALYHGSYYLSNPMVRISK